MSESLIGTITPVKKVVKGSCGVLLPNTRAKIVDLSTGRNLGPGKRGELCVQGPQVKQ